MLTKIICSAYFGPDKLSSFMILFKSQPVIPVSEILSKKNLRTKYNFTEIKQGRILNMEIL